MTLDFKTKKEIVGKPMKKPIWKMKPLKDRIVTIKDLKVPDLRPIKINK